MLVITRKVFEAIKIGDNVVVRICLIDRGKVRIGIECPKEMIVLRSELLDKRKDTTEPYQTRSDATH